MSSRVVSISFHPVPQEQPRMSCRKYLERRIVCAWKVVSQRSRRRHRTSILPEDFVLLTTRRRSIRYV